MKKRVFCLFAALLCLMSALLCSCSSKSATEGTTMNPEQSEFQSKIDEKLDFDYDLGYEKPGTVNDFVSAIGEIYTNIPAFKSAEDLNEEYIRNFFIRYYSGIDPKSCDIVEGKDGKTTACVNKNRVLSLLFRIFRIEDYELPAKEKSPDFYADGSKVYVTVIDTGDAVYHVSETTDSDGSAGFVMKRVEGKDGVESFRINLAKDEFGYYISSIEN